MLLTILALTAFVAFYTVLMLTSVEIAPWVAKKLDNWKDRKRHCWLRLKLHRWEELRYSSTVYSIGDSIGYHIYTKICSNCGLVKEVPLDSKPK